MATELDKRKEELFWEKCKEIWNDWKVTISILWSLLLIFVGMTVFAIIWWTRGYDYSGEVDAAMINSLVAIFITVPITLATGAGTILVTAYFNLQTQRIAVQAQRSQLRDVLLQERIDIYREIESRTFEINIMATQIQGYDLSEESKEDFYKKLESFDEYLYRKRRFISHKLRKEIGRFRMQCEKFYAIKKFVKDPQHSEDFLKKIEEYYRSINKLIDQELDFRVLDYDWVENQANYTEEADQ